MEVYSIIGVSGSVDYFIMETFEKLGIGLEYNVNNTLDDPQPTIIITYGTNTQYE